MNQEQMESTIRRLGTLQKTKIELIDKFEEVIRNSPLVIDEEGQPQLTKHIAMIALSTDQMKPDDTQAGGYGIVRLDRPSPLLFGYHNGKNTSTIIFCLKAVRKIIKSTPNDESLTIITRNEVVADYLKGEKTINSSSKAFPYVSGCIEDIEKMFAERTAPVYGYWMQASQDVDWLKSFSELARKVASESRKLCLVTDDDRQWDAAHPLSASLSPPAQQHLEQGPQRAQASSSSSSLLPPSSQQQRSQQQQNSQQGPRRARESPSPSSRQLPEEHAQPAQVPLPSTSQQQLTPVAKQIIRELQSSCDEQKRRIQAMKTSGEKLGVVCNRDIILDNECSPNDRNHIAFLSMSSNAPRSDGYQFGGYSVVWVDGDNTSIEYNYYDNVVPGAIFFLLLGLRDALRTCPLNEPLLVATTNQAVVNYVNNKKLAKRQGHMESCLIEIEHIMGKRTAPTIAFLIGQYPGYPWVKDSYGLARHIAGEARKLGNLERNPELLSSKDSSEVDSDPFPAGPSSKQQEQTGQASVGRSSRRSGKQANYNTESIIQNLRALETRRMELLETPNKRIKVGKRTINLDHQPQRGKATQLVVIAMSTDIARQDTGCQAGGFGAVWLNKKSGNQFGNYDSPGAGTLIFLLKAVQEVLAECPLDVPLVIASKSKIIVNFINDVRKKPSREIEEVNICFEEIEDQLRKRKASTESILLDKENLREVWMKSFYSLSRNVASEARKLWFAYSEEEKVSLAPSRFEENKASSSSSISASSRNQARQVPVQMPPHPASSSITHPDGLHKSLINQANQHSLEGVRPSRAAAIGLVNTLPFPTSAVESNDSNGVHIDRDQVHKPWMQSVQSMNTMPPPSQLANTSASTAYYPLPVSPAMVHSSSMTEPQAAGYGQYNQDALSTSDYIHGYPRSFDTSFPVTDQPTTSMSIPMTSVSIQHEYQDRQYKNKRPISQGDESETNKRHRIDPSEESKSEDGGGIISRIWDNPVGKWMNRMFGRS